MRERLNDEQVLDLRRKTFDAAGETSGSVFVHRGELAALLDERDRLRGLLASGIAFVRDANQLMAADGDLDEEDEAMANDWIRSAQAELAP